VDNLDSLYAFASFHECDITSKSIANGADDSIYNRCVAVMLSPTELKVPSRSSLALPDAILVTFVLLPTKAGFSARFIQQRPENRADNEMGRVAYRELVLPLRNVCQVGYVNRGKLFETDLEGDCASKTWTDGCESSHFAVRVPRVLQ
jgi:hypothetical protein